MYNIIQVWFQLNLSSTHFYQLEEFFSLISLRFLLSSFLSETTSIAAGITSSAWPVWPKTFLRKSPISSSSTWGAEASKLSTRPNPRRHSSTPSSRCRRRSEPSVVLSSVHCHSQDHTWPVWAKRWPSACCASVCRVTSGALSFQKVFQTPLKYRVASSVSQASEIWLHSLSYYHLLFSCLTNFCIRLQLYRFLLIDLSCLTMKLTHFITWRCK